MEKEPISWISSSRPHLKLMLPPRRGESGVLSVILEPQHPALMQFKQLCRTEQSFCWCRFTY